MTFESQWEDNLEDGTTLGPEEALKKEIEKTKALKVERLRLQNQVEALQIEAQKLKKENLDLKEELRKFGKSRVEKESNESEEGFRKLESNPVLGHLTKLFSFVFVMLVFGLFYFFLTY